MPRLATTEDLGAVERTLGLAFSDYPWTNWTIPDDRHIQRIGQLQRLYIERLALTDGMVWITDNAEAVAVFVPASAPPPDPAFWDRVREIHGQHFTRVIEAEEMLSPIRPPHDWVLATVGVMPEESGKGLGTAVIRAGLELLDARHESSLVETSTPGNARLYRRLGWRDVAATQTSGPLVWTMHRPAPETAQSRVADSASVPKVL